MTALTPRETMAIQTHQEQHSFKTPLARGKKRVIEENQSKSIHTLGQIDQKLHAHIAQTLFFAPPALINTYVDWIMNLTYSPGRQIELTYSALQKLQQFAEYATNADCQTNPEKCAVPIATDRRYRDEAWKKPPFNLYQQASLLLQNWWMEATSDVRGMTAHHSDILPFMTRQILDTFSPLNFPQTNPVILEKTREEKGMNFIRGFHNLIEDITRHHMKEPAFGTEAFQVGINLATSKGRVVFQNELIELIQYSPLTEDVHKEPLLFVPAWIMKYYILDLSPGNSLVKFMLEAGHTVFMISWKNPSKEDKHLGFEDYMNLGVKAALGEIEKIIPHTKIHAAGYCLGGTLLTITAADMAKHQDHRLATLTLLAAQTDFTEAGELLFFIDEAQLTYLEDMMAEKGYFDASQMTGAFNMLRSHDLIWSQIVEQYMLGNRIAVNDFMAWNRDSTRLPYRMHTEYLRKLYLNNDLTEGRFTIEGHPILLQNIRIPIFCVGTEKDHISPWKSVYKIHMEIDSDIDFILASGGHNVGIISRIGHPKAEYRMLHQKHTDPHMSPDEWLVSAPSFKGSWWTAWKKWLSKKSTEKVKARPVKSVKGLLPAPGSYVHMK